MKSAVIAVQEGNGLRSVARMFDVPLETLQRRVVGSVSIDCKPGPKTELTKEEDLIFRYCINMCEMDMGLFLIILMAPLLINPISTTDDNADSLTERLKDVLVLPKDKSTKRSRSTNSSARCITDDSFIEVQEKLKEKRFREEEKEARD